MDRAVVCSTRFLDDFCQPFHTGRETPHFHSGRSRQDEDRSFLPVHVDWSHDLEFVPAVVWLQIEAKLDCGSAVFTHCGYRSSHSTLVGRRVVCCEASSIFVGPKQIVTFIAIS